MTTAAKPDEASAGAKPAGKFQFRIRDLLIVTVLVGLFFGGLYEQNPWLLLAAVVGTIGCMFLLWRQTLVEVLVVVGLVGIFLALFLPSSGSHWAHGQINCSNSLKHIGIALHTYHDVYQSLPPAFIADQDGKPMHSWRVLLLPFLEQDALYQRYRFDEPWNGPNNRLLAAEIARVYACPAEPNSNKRETNYVAIVGTGTPWPGETSTRLADFKDGMSNVILIVEVHQSGIHCMEPRDLELSTFSPRVNPAKGTGISSRHPWKKDMRRTIYGAHVLMGDGSVQFLGPATDSKAIESMLRINDGTIPLEDAQQ